MLIFLRKPLLFVVFITHSIDQLLWMVISLDIVIAVIEKNTNGCEN